MTQSHSEYENLSPKECKTKIDELKAKLQKIGEGKSGFLQIGSDFVSSRIRNKLKSTVDIIAMAEVWQNDEDITPKESGHVIECPPYGNVGEGYIVIAPTLEEVMERINYIMDDAEEDVYFRVFTKNLTQRGMSSVERDKRIIHRKIAAWEEAKNTGELDRQFRDL